MRVMIMRGRSLDMNARTGREWGNLEKEKPTVAEGRGMSVEQV